MNFFAFSENFRSRMQRWQSCDEHLPQDSQYFSVKRMVMQK